MIDPKDYQISPSTQDLLLLRADAEAFGFAYVERAISDGLITVLAAEAKAQSIVARYAAGEEPNPYRSRLANLGDQGQTFLADPSIAQLFQAVFQQPFVMSHEASCYTYYGPGDFLGRHRDRPIECAATLIVYLDAASDSPHSPQTGLMLRIFDEEGTMKRPRMTIPTRPGALVLGYGSRFWHERPVLRAGERVVALTACFCAA
jgi:hypothetical protein